MSCHGYNFPVGMDDLVTRSSFYYQCGASENQYFKICFGVGHSPQHFGVIASQV